jgi:hypothetical protein
MWDEEAVLVGACTPEVGGGRDDRMVTYIIIDRLRRYIRCN